MYLLFHNVYFLSILKACQYNYFSTFSHEKSESQIFPLPRFFLVIYLSLVNIINLFCSAFSYIYVYWQLFLHNGCCGHGHWCSAQSWVNISQYNGLKRNTINNNFAKETYDYFLLSPYPESLIFKSYFNLYLLHFLLFQHTYMACNCAIIALILLILSIGVCPL